MASSGALDRKKRKEEAPRSATEGGPYGPAVLPADNLSHPHPQAPLKLERE